MSDKSQVLCKYYVSGVCRFGAECTFSHNLSDLPNQVCKYYLAGCCAYGDRCRYDHKRPEYWKANNGQGQQGQGRGLPQDGHALQTQQRASAGTGCGQSDGSGSVRPSPSSNPTGGPPGAADVNSVLAGSEASASTCAGDLQATAATVMRGENQAADIALGETARSLAGGGGDVAGDSGTTDQWGGDGGYGEACAVEATCGQAEERVQQAVDGMGLVLLDDDVGLVEEARAVAAAAAARGRESKDPQGTVNGINSGSAVNADGLGGRSCWAAEQHPWERGNDDATEAQARDGPVDPADEELCPRYALHGVCAEGECCALVHGLECETCHQFRIHPHNPTAAEEHRETCRLRCERLEARMRSAGVECGICLEPVLSKASVSDRRFGLLACEHSFCLPCIRSWRERTTDSSLATDTAVRTCPVCRTPTHFITPSLVWPATAEEKETIVAAYKAKLASIDCKHFDFGNGNCPFSTSCFYRHMYRDGRVEEPSLRRAGNADGDVRVVAPVRLAAFFDTPHAQRLLTRRR